MIGSKHLGFFFTIEDEAYMERMIRESVEFMKRYGKGVQPLLAGHPLSRKGQTKQMKSKIWTEFQF